MSTGKNRYHSQLVPLIHYAHPNKQHAPDYYKSLRIENRAKASESTYRLYHKWIPIRDCLPRVDMESTSPGYSKTYNYLDTVGEVTNLASGGGTELPLSEMSTYFSTLL